jgi:hypothetical protein
MQKIRSLLIGAMALSGCGAVALAPGLAGAAGSTPVTQTLTGAVAPTITLTQTAPGTNLTTLIPGATSTGTVPDLSVSANTAYLLTVTPSTFSTNHLSNPLHIATTATAGTGNTNAAPTGASVTIAWGSSATTTIGSGTAAADAGGTVNPDTFSGAISQPVSFGDAQGAYSVTLTYVATSGT